MLCSLTQTDQCWDDYDGASQQPYAMVNAAIARTLHQLLRNAPRPKAMEGAYAHRRGELIAIAVHQFAAVNAASVWSAS